MQVLSTADPSAPIACTLSPTEFRVRLRALEAVVGDDVRTIEREPGRLRFRLDRGDRPGLEAKVTTWAREEKACCAFLGFAVDWDDTSVTMEIEAPSGADLTLDGIEWLVRAAAGASHGV